MNVLASVRSNMKLRFIHRRILGKIGEAYDLFANQRDRVREVAIKL